MDPADRLTFATLGAALLDELLPANRDGQTVLLGCDDEALAAACARAGARGDPPLLLRHALAAMAPLTVDDGLRPLLDVLTGPPADLPVLCACVLAASRMRPDERHATQAYYARLAEVLGLPVRGAWPGVAGFERIPDRFRAFAGWLDRHEFGRRGRLALPTSPQPVLVGVPISQALLRRVDRDRLGGLFDRYRGALRIGRDPLRLLRTSAVRHELTAPVQRLLRRAELAEPLRAALEAAYQAWDGTVLDGRCRRLRAGSLRVGLSPGRATLNLSLPGLADSAPVRGPDGAARTIPAWPGELSLPTAWLVDAADGPVALATGSGPAIRALPGPLMLFDVADSGFWLTGTAGDQPVIVLTCEPTFTARNWGTRRARVALPTGWALICDVSADELPSELRHLDGDEDLGDGGPVTLVGGLRLDAGVWLIDHPPHLAGDLDEPAAVDAVGPDGQRRQLGELLPDEPFALEAIAAQVGTHLIEVADQRFEIEIADRGLREGAGALAHYPRAPQLATAGAVDLDAAAAYGPPTLAVCGAAVDGAGDPSWCAPLTVRTQAPVHAIRRDGTVSVHAPGVAPHWARQAGLPPGGPWPIPNGDRVVWLCVQSRAHRRVLALRDEPVPPTDAVLDLADRFADAPVIDRSDTGNAAAHWQALVREACTQETAVDG